MRRWICSMVVSVSMACGQASEVVGPPSPEQVPVVPAESPRLDPRAPGFADSGRISVARFDDEELRECYDVFLAIEDRASDASLPEVGARQLALVLLDYAVVSGAQGAGPVDDPRAQVTELLETYVAGVAPPGLSEEERARHVESARVFQSMTWPTETLEYEAENGALVETNECSDLDRSPLAVCHLKVEKPRFVWSIRRAHFIAGDTSDSEAGREWCRRHGGEWTADAPGGTSGRVE